MPQAQKGAELWLFTMRFPFGTGEAFLEHELPFLAARFQRVLLFPLEADGEPRDLPGNVEVVRPFDRIHARADWWSLLRSLPLLLRVRRVVRRDAPTRAAFRSQWPEVRSRLRQALHREQGLRARFARRYTAGGVLLYSYWTSDWATVLGLWRCRDDRVRFISRIMGFDLFADRARDGWQALQAFHLAQAWRVFAASRAGLEHLRARHPLHADRLRLAYMATPDMGAGPWHRSAGPLRVVSCSNLFPLKRVPMLAQALAAMDRPVEWTHFGDGPDRKALRAVMERLPEAVQVHLPGAVANRQVLEHFRRQEVEKRSVTIPSAPMQYPSWRSLAGCDTRRSPTTGSAPEYA